MRGSRRSLQGSYGTKRYVTFQPKTLCTLPRVAIIFISALLFIYLRLVVSIIQQTFNARGLPVVKHKSGKVHLPDLTSRESLIQQCCLYGGIPLPVNNSLRQFEPKLLGIGVHKSGTSYLFNLLKLHPKFIPPVNQRKELLMFAQWPLQWDSFTNYLSEWDMSTTNQAQASIRYEVSATYLHVPGAACRVAAVMPNAKFLVVLRDPIKRALSHYNMELNLYKRGERQFEPIPFYLAVNRELRLFKESGCDFQGGGPLGGSTEHYGLLWNQCFKCWYLKHDFALRQRMCDSLGDQSEHTPCNPKFTTGQFTTLGIYAPPIKWWLAHFKPSQFLFINNEQMEKDPVAVGNRVSQFMGVDQIYRKQLVEQKIGVIDRNTYSKLMDTKHQNVTYTIRRLKKFYRPQIVDLYKLMNSIGAEFQEFKDWPRHRYLPW